MVRPVCQGVGVVAELDDVGLAADGIELAFALQAVGKRQLVDGDAAVVEVFHGLVDLLVRRAVEHVGAQLCHCLLDDIGREEHGREHGLFRIDVLRHDALDVVRIVGIGKLWHSTFAALSRAFHIRAGYIQYPAAETQVGLAAGFHTLCGFGHLR